MGTLSPLRFAFTVSHFTDEYVENKIKEGTGALERWLRGPGLGSQHLSQGAPNCLYLQLQGAFHPPLVYMDTLTQTRTASHRHRHGHPHTHTDMDILTHTRTPSHKETWAPSHNHRHSHTHRDTDTLTQTQTPSRGQEHILFIF